MPSLTILIPAAGSSSRMAGTDKLLQVVGAQPMLRRQAELALSVCPRVIVSLRPVDPLRLAALKGLAVTCLAVPDAASGMSASLRRAAAMLADPTMTGAAMPDSTMTGAAMMILPADMPDLDASDLRKLIEAFDHAPALIHRGATPDGAPGHPVILPAWLLAQVATLSGDEGARALLARHPSRINLIALPDQHAITDLDTPADWAKWRAAQVASNTRAS